MMMDDDQTTQQITLGLRKKYQDNDLDCYQTMLPKLPTATITSRTDAYLETIYEEVNLNPQNYFNFGFTFNDFKAYLLKITYCRALRKFIQRKRLEKILQFQKNNQHAAFLSGFFEQANSNVKDEEDNLNGTMDQNKIKEEEERQQM